MKPWSILQRELHGWRALAVATALLVLAHVCAALAAITPILNGQLWDPDAYFQLAWAEELWQHGAWYDTSFQRVNAPYGNEVHVSRLFSLLLLLGASPFAAFVGMGQALWIWGILIGPLFHWLALLALSFGTRRLFSDRAFVLLAVLFIFNRPVIEYFLPGRPDHHGVLLLMLTIILALMMRLVDGSRGQRDVALMGILCGLAFGISAEALIIAAAAYTGLTLFWIQRGDAHAFDVPRFSYWLALTQAVALLAMIPPSGWFEFSGDRVSILYVGIAACIGLLFYAAQSLPSGWTASRPQRLGMVALGAGAGLLGLVLIDPDMLRGPLHAIDPFIYEVLVSQTMESSSLIPRDTISWFLFLPNIGPSILAALYLATRLLRYRFAETVSMELVLLGGMLVLAPYALHMVRGAAFLAAATVIPWTLLIIACWRRLSAPDWRARSLAAALCGVLILGHWASAVALAQATGLDVDWKKKGRCNYGSIQSILNRLEHPEGTVLTDFYDGYEVLYRSRLSVVGTPYHRNIDGIKDTIRFFTSDLRADIGRRLARQRDIRYVLVCADQRLIHSVARQGNTSMMLFRLSRGQPPAWLQPVALPQSADRKLRLYRVDR